MAEFLVEFGAELVLVFGGGAVGGGESFSDLFWVEGRF